MLAIFLLVCAACVQVAHGQVSFVLGGRSGQTDGNVLAFSTDDGGTFQSASTSFLNSANPRIRSVAFSAEQDLWVGCGSPDVTARNQSMMWSPDGMNWTQGVTDADFVCLGVAWGYNSARRSGLWVAVGGNGVSGAFQIFESGNGTHWKLVLSGVSLIEAGKWVTYSSVWDRFLMVGDSGLTGYRASNSTWIINPTTDMTLNFERVASSPVTGFAVATSQRDGSYFTSTDGGLTWGGKTADINVGYIGLAWANGAFVISGFNSTGSSLTVSYIADNGSFAMDSTNLALSMSNQGFYICASPLSGSVLVFGGSNNDYFKLNQTGSFQM